MAFVPLEKIKEGMMIVTEVRDSFGRVLMNAGTAVTTRQIEALEKYGIQEVDISFEDALKEPSADPMDNEQFKTASREVEMLFSSADREWDVMAAIHTASVHLIMGRTESAGGSRDT